MFIFIAISGQTEKLHKNGVKHITYANGLQRIINPDTSEEVLMTDGTIWRIHSDGSEVLEFADGDREIRTNKYKVDIDFCVFLN